MTECLVLSGGPAAAGMWLDPPIMSVARCLIGHDAGNRLSRRLAARVVHELIDRTRQALLPHAALAAVVSDFFRWRAEERLPDEAHAVAAVATRSADEWLIAYVGNCEAMIVGAGRAQPAFSPHTPWHEESGGRIPSSAEEQLAASVPSRALGWANCSIGQASVHISPEDAVVLTSTAVWHDLTALADKLTGKDPIELYRVVRGALGAWSAGQSAVIWSDR